MSYLIYRTQDGDRWDLIAWAQYGDPMLYPIICYANPGVSPVAILAGGIDLKVPILEETVEEHAAWAPWNL